MPPPPPQPCRRNLRHQTSLAMSVIYINMKSMSGINIKAIRRFSIYFDASDFICSMSSFTKIRDGVNLHALKALSTCPFKFRTNSQAKWVKFSNICSMSQHNRYKVNVSLKAIFSKLRHVDIGQMKTCRFV